MSAREFWTDVWDVIGMANRHPRVDILKPGPGVGGHCIAVDPWFIVDSAPELTPLIQAARHVNDGKPEHVVDRVLAATKDLGHPRIACLGLSYKANIDDLRESPAVHIVQRLAERLDGRGTILVVEPHVPALPPIHAPRERGGERDAQRRRLRPRRAQAHRDAEEEHGRRHPARHGVHAGTPCLHSTRFSSQASDPSRPNAARKMSHPSV